MAFVPEDWDFFGVNPWASREWTLLRHPTGRPLVLITLPSASSFLNAAYPIGVPVGAFDPAARPAGAVAGVDAWRGVPVALIGLS